MQAHWGNLQDLNLFCRSSDLLVSNMDGLNSLTSLRIQCMWEAEV